MTGTRWIFAESMLPETLVATRLLVGRDSKEGLETHTSYLYQPVTGGISGLTFSQMAEKQTRGFLEIPRVLFRRYVFHRSNILVTPIVLNGDLSSCIDQHGTRPEESGVARQ